MLINAFGYALQWQWICMPEVCISNWSKEWSERAWNGEVADQQLLKADYKPKWLWWELWILEEDWALYLAIFNKEWLSEDSVNSCGKNKLEDRNPITVYPSVDHYRRWWEDVIHDWSPVMSRKSDRSGKIFSMD